MSGDNSSPSTTAGSPANLGAAVSPQELKAASGKAGTATARATARWKAEQPTGAFDSAAVSFRFMPKAYNWYGVLGSMLVLYGGFIGVPVGAGLWALWRVGSIVGWW